MTVQMPNGIYVFGGVGVTSKMTYEYLPRDSKVWQTIPYFQGDIVSPLIGLSREDARTGIQHGSGHRVSNEELILIKYQHMVRFNVMNTSWYAIPLRVGRWDAASIILNNMLIICGGCFKQNGLSVGFTEIVDLTTNQSRMGGNLNVARAGFGMALIVVRNKLRLLAFGGIHKEKEVVTTIHNKFIDSVEIWDEVTESWMMTDMKLQQKRRAFGYVSVSSRDFPHFVEE